MEQVDTIIVGGGQAGLSTSYYLKQQGMEHLLLERASCPAHVWKDGRWDSFTLVTPNEAFSVPGAEYRGAEPGAFMLRNEVVAIFDRYVDEHGLSVQFNTQVDRIEAADNGRFNVTTSEGNYDARNVVIATGYEQTPKIPASASSLSNDVVQMHSSQYRNPQSLPDGAVLVVGTAQSGAQIAEELYQSGRKVFLCVGGAGRAPRRYRGKDVFMWLLDVGFFDRTEDQFPFPKEQFSPPHVSGRDGGHTLNLHQFSKDGVTLLGHFKGVENGKVNLAPDLHESLGRIDGFEKNVQKMIDGFIEARGLDNPSEELPELNHGFAQPITEELDLAESGVTSVIWATGYAYDYSLVKAPVLDSRGFPVQTRGVTNQPGLYFVGMPWMPSLKPGTLAGVGEAARQIAEALSRVQA